MDNGSVFTRRISDLLESAKTEYDLKAFSSINLESISKYQAFILSGRKSNDKKMNSVNSKIIQHSVENSKKLLGICYGAELLALALGGTIRKMSSPQKGEEKITPTGPNSLLSGPITAYESHGYELAKLGPLLESTASSDSCLHEMIQHKSRKIFGTQFHPEMSDDGSRLIESFLDL